MKYLYGVIVKHMFSKPCVTQIVYPLFSNRKHYAMQFPHTVRAQHALPNSGGMYSEEMHAPHDLPSRSLRELGSLTIRARQAETFATYTRNGWLYDGLFNKTHTGLAC